VVVRLPSGSAGQHAGYWAFSLNAPFVIAGLSMWPRSKSLKRIMAILALSIRWSAIVQRTVFDPLKMMSIREGVGGGGIAQGSDLRPPLELRLKFAMENFGRRME